MRAAGSLAGRERRRELCHRVPVPSGEWGATRVAETIIGFGNVRLIAQGAGTCIPHGE